MNKIRENFIEWRFQNILMPFYDFMCRRGYHTMHWQSGMGYEHCNCGQAILNDDSSLLYKLTEIRADGLGVDGNDYPADEWCCIVEAVHDTIDEVLERELAE